MHPAVRRCRLPGAILILLVAGAVGCRQAPLLDLTTAQRPADRPRLDPRLVAALEASLRDGEWQRIPNWSLLDLTARHRSDSSRVEIPARWHFVATTPNGSRPAKNGAGVHGPTSSAPLVRGQSPAPPSSPGVTGKSESSETVPTSSDRAASPRQAIRSDDEPSDESSPDTPDPMSSAPTLDELLDRLDELAPHAHRAANRRGEAELEAGPRDASRADRDMPDGDDSYIDDAADADLPPLAEVVGPSGSGRYLARLAERDDVVGRHAALIWGRRDPAAATTVLPVLEQLVLRGETGPALRAAAAEIWCRVAAQAPGDVEANLAPIGRALLDPLLPVEVRGELCRGLGPYVPPDRIPLLSDAFDEAAPSPPVELRRAAIDTCLIHALHAAHPAGNAGDDTASDGEASAFDESLWPTTIGRCAWDADPLVRRTYGRWLVLAREPHAFSVLVTQLADLDRRVRDDALLGLGVLGTPDARDELVRQSRRPEELVRALAVRGLSRFGFETIAAAETDRAAAVRTALAASCADLPTAPAAIALCRLATDADLQVQRAATEAVRDWPDALAVPVLLHVLQESALTTRRLALTELRARVGNDEPVRLDGSQRERREAALRIAARAGVALDLLQAARDGARSDSAPSAQTVAEIAGALRTLSDPAANSVVRDAALTRLRQLERRDLPAVEDLLLRDPTLRPREVLDEILPALDERHAALRDLQAEDVFVRRRGAGRLAQLATSATLSPFVVARLEELLTREQDRLVWHHAMNAVGPDASDEGARLALLALNHVWPDIRLLGCRHVARHGRPQHGPWLMPLFDDRDPSVRLAAVEAAGVCRNPLVLSDRPGGDGTVPLRGLRSLMPETDPRLHLAVLAAMSRLGDPTAMDELVRLGFQESAGRRIAVVRTMAETGRTRFVDPLVRWAWTESDDHVRRAIVQSLAQLVPGAEQPPQLDRAETDRDRVRLWVAWHEAHRRDAEQASRGTAAPP